VPELPEVEAWRRQLDPLVKKHPIERAGPAHVATLKTIDPPLHALGGEAFRGVERRAKRFLLPTDDGELVLMVHLMSAGRLRYVRPGEKSPKMPMFRLRFVDGGELVLTEAGSKKRAGVWLLHPDALEAELAHLGPEADQLGPEQLARILASDARRLHSLLRDQRLIAGIGRAWANEILWAAQLSPYALSTQLDEAEVKRLAAAIHDELARGLELRLGGANDAKTYRVHDRLGRPCARCATPLARVDFEEHTISYCPTCQTGGKVLSPYWGLGKGRQWEDVQYASRRTRRTRR
jgi:formamidopyrimidine-DNA glycosylase